MTAYIKNMRKYIGHERLLIAGASVFIHKNGKLLLQKRKDNGCWGEHGGCCELGETVEETARRELLEETGLVAGELELLGVFSGAELFYTYPNGDQVANVNVAYLCDDFTGELTAETDETSELRWFALDDLPGNISPPIIPALKRCVEVLRARAGEKPCVDIVPIDENSRARVDALIADSWGGPYMVTKGILHDTRTHPGFVAVENGEVLGYILFHIHDGNCEITVLESLREKRGIGTALVNRAAQAAKDAQCRKIWLITTNDNTHAMRFYQKLGFTLAAAHIHAMDASRKLKPGIPATGCDGIPIQHEMELERPLMEGYFL